MEVTNKEGEPMRRVFIALAVFAFAVFAGNQWIEGIPVAGGSTDQDYLQYDDGTAFWLTWGGQWRGVWFNVVDFNPGGTGYSMDFSEYWFFHHTSYPWDVSDFYAEVWNGDYLTPTALLDQTMVTAIHFTPVYVNFSTPLVCQPDFWGLVNTEMSAGGFPALLGDNTPPAVDHSYFSDDFYVWEPWGMGDYFVRVDGEIVTNALDNDTWGAIKSIF